MRTTKAALKAFRKISDTEKMEEGHKDPAVNPDGVQKIAKAAVDAVKKAAKPSGKKKADHGSNKKERPASW